MQKGLHIFYYRFSKLKLLLKHIAHNFYHKNFNSVVKQQLKDYKCIPIIIISFNQLNYLKQLIQFLLDKQYTNVIIIDNNSTYKPLIDYFNEIDGQVKIHRLSENAGHLSFWKQRDLFTNYNKGYYVITDPDIVPINECPENFIQTFRVLLDRAYDRTKVGFSLALSDLPHTNPNKERIIEWESQFWISKIRPDVYKAEIDTTFALYRPGYDYRLKDFTKAWRTDFPLQAKHGGWYIDTNNLTDEQYYYMKTSNESASWQINDHGDLVNKVHKSLYKNE